jgi:hypothetical protein
LLLDSIPFPSSFLSLSLGILFSSKATGAGRGSRGGLPVPPPSHPHALMPYTQSTLARRNNGYSSPSMSAQPRRWSWRIANRLTTVAQPTARRGECITYRSLPRACLSPTTVLRKTIARQNLTDCHGTDEISTRMM